MPVSTLSAAFHITPVVLSTFAQHGKRKAEKLKKGEPEDQARDDILFDEAFNIVRSFLDMTTKNTVESTQTFMNTHIPAPPWNAVSPVVIPLLSCNRAADVLIDWFGKEELNAIGGERWWQVRGLDGIDAEWVTEKDFLDEKLQDAPKGISDLDANILKMNKLDTVMLYVHGGGYFWGSINTHRYQISRYAREINGRAFAVNYRKAPQYPWPCPVQDVLAAYLYLIDPPPGALHTAVPPSKIVLAGDSAGGGLSLTLLTILRDLSLPMPAGAILISPWVDLTHSFPSVMTNIKGDIIPVHGFISKPSTLWPVDLLPPEGGRVRQAQSGVPPFPGDADTLKPSVERVVHDEKEQEQGEGESAATTETQEEMLSEKDPEEAHETQQVDQEYADLEKWEPKPPKVLMEDPDAVPLELRSQIQLYATTEQLTHPLVSPILQGSLGNLPPLYIIAGQEEVLRDEIIYLAHRAAMPSKYQARKGALTGHRQRHNAEQYTTPTKVHLQVFDGMCHVLTVFTFTESAKYAYRTIADFVKRVTVEPESSQSSLASQRQQSSPALDGADMDGSLLSESNDSVEACKEMIRERVDIAGHVRPMEPEEDIECLRLPSSQIGLIKEAPSRRWLEGQEKWDRKYKRAAKKALKKRRKFETKTKRLLDHAMEEGLVLHEGPALHAVHTNPVTDTKGTIQKERRWGPLDLDDERPPPSAIAKRRDTPEAYALIKKHIYHTAPNTHRTIPAVKPMDAVIAAFDPEDEPLRPPRQSASEQQARNMIFPVHGLKMWDSIIGYFMRKSSAKASRGKDYATAALKSVGGQISEKLTPEGSKDNVPTSTST